MKTFIIAVWVFLVVSVASICAQPTSFIYQGSLTDNGSPAEGEYDLRFSLHNSISGGGVIGDPITIAPVAVTEGLFTVALDFGAAAFDGQPRWLELGVRPHGDQNPHTALTPRQTINSTPYAIRAMTAGNADAALTISGTVPASKIGGVIVSEQLAAGSVTMSALADGAVTDAKISGIDASKILGAISPSQIGAGTLGSAVVFDNQANVFHGAFTGSGAGLTAVPGTMPWVVVNETGRQAEANAGYLLLNDNLTIVNLPSTAIAGDAVRVHGVGMGGWVILRHGEAPGMTWTARESVRDWISVASSADGVKLAALASPGRIYTSSDSGVTWTARENSRNWGAVASSAGGDKLIAVEHGGRIYTSSDSGATWTPRESWRIWRSVASSADGVKLVAVVSGGQIYTSADSGVTWTPRESSRSWQSVASSADGSRLAAAVDGGQIYTSTDAGATWVARDSNRRWWALASSSDGTKLVAAVTGLRIYTSIDSGVTWTPRESNRSWHSVASSADGSRLVAGVHGGQIYTSTDAGATWVARDSNRRWWALASSADGTRLAAGALNSQLFTSDLVSTLAGDGNTSATVRYMGGDRWLPVNDRIAPAAVGSAELEHGAVNTASLADNAVTDGKIQSVSASKVSGVLPASQIGAGTITSAVTLENASGAFSGDGTGLKNVPGTLPWVAVDGPEHHGASNTGCLLENDDLTTVYLPESAEVGDIIRVNGIGAGGWEIRGGPAGDSWIARGSNLVWRAVASSADGRTLAAVEYENNGGGHVHVSSDSGVTWSMKGPPNNWGAVALSADGTRLAAAANTVRVSGNLGASWSAGLFDAFRVWTSLALSADGTKLVAVSYYDSYDDLTPGRIHTSADGGETWTLQAGAGGSAWQAVASSADGAKLVAADRFDGIFTSADCGATWTARSGIRDCYSVASSADGTTLAATVYDGQIHVSTDSGVTWAPREGNRQWFSVACSGGGTRLAAVASNDQIYISTDSGETWTPKGDALAWSSVASSANGSKLVAVASHRQIHTSVAPVVLAGSANSSGAVQCVGGGIWVPVKESGVAAGSIAASQLASDSVTTTALANGAVTSEKISGVLDPAQIPDLDATKVSTGLLDPDRIPFVDAYVRIIEVRAGDAGGNSAGVNVRAFTTKVIDTQKLAALSDGGSSIRLAAGVYRCHISAPGYRVDRHQIRLRIKGGGILLYGTSEFSESGLTGGGVTSRSEIDGQFTLASESDLQVEHFMQLAKSSNGLGPMTDASWPNPRNVYAVANLWRIK